MQDQRSSDATIEHWQHWPATNHPGGHRAMSMTEETAMCAARIAAALASAGASV
jgi:hypothetical protein